MSSPEQSGRGDPSPLRITILLTLFIVFDVADIAGTCAPLPQPPVKGDLLNGCQFHGEGIDGTHRYAGLAPEHDHVNLYHDVPSGAVGDDAPDVEIVDDDGQGLVTLRRLGPMPCGSPWH